MTMTSSQQQTSFLNTNGNPPPMPPPPPMQPGGMNPLTPNSINASPTITTFRPSQFQTQPSRPQPNQNQNPNNNPAPPSLMQQFHVSQQQQLQLLQAQQYLRNQQMMNHPSFNLMNSMGNMGNMGNMGPMPTMISPGTPSLPMAMPSPNVIPNVSTTPRQQFPMMYHRHHHHTHHAPNPYMSNMAQQQQQQQQQHESGAAVAHLTPQQRPQTPITTIGGTSAPSVASITSFTPSMASLGPTTILGITAASGNFGGSAGGGSNQPSNDLPHAQPTRFTSIDRGGGPPNNNNQNNRNPNDRNQGNTPNDEDGKQSNEGMGDTDDEPSAVLGQPPNSIIVNVSSNNKYGLRNYLVRARRILRLAKKCRICGIGSAVSVACEVTEVLKRECVANVMSISTGLIEDEQSTRPTIEIVVTRGDFAHLVSDFRRRKVIEVFEKKDQGIAGALSFDFVRRLDLATKFKADGYRTHQAQHYLQRLEGDPEIVAVNLPKFIHYCSIIIHPLLLEYHFKMAISELGGYVDVHDGHLPREHTADKVEQLQKLGRIEPFLKKGDDIEFDPQDFKHWFTDRHRLHHHHHHHHHHHQRSTHPNIHSMERISMPHTHTHTHTEHTHALQHQSPPEISMPSAQQNVAYPQPHNVYNTHNRMNMAQYPPHAHTDMTVNPHRIRPQQVQMQMQPPCPNYPNPNMMFTDDVDSKGGQDTTSGGSLGGVGDDNTTTNALDGSMVTPTVTTEVHDAVAQQKTDDPIPEDESITQDVDEFDHSREIINKMDNMTEEDDGSQVQPPSDASKPTTILSVNTEN